MRVLHIGKFYPPYKGGMENFLKDLLKGLQREGVSVAGLIHHHESGRPISREMMDGVDVWRVPCWGQLLYVPISPSFPIHLKGILRQFQPDLLHMHLPNASAFWALSVTEARSLPWVVQWQSDVVPSEVDRRLKLAYLGYRPFEQAILKRAERVIVASRAYLEGSPPLRKWAHKCCVVPLGVDPERLPLPDQQSVGSAEESWSPGASLRVLAVGRLTYYKGFKVLIDSAQHSRGISVQIVGDGALRNELEEDICRRNLEGRVQLRGAIQEMDLQALLCSCDCLCLPSIERTEAFGIVLLEAMRYGKALVATDIHGSGAGWVVRHGPAGLLVPPGDSRALAKAFGHLISQPQLLKELSQKGKEAFERIFQISAVAKAVKEIYREVLKT